ncbi:chromogranin-A isoform X1 [Polypterus senegalus]|uniref:chromogranin-A isoform X1 n=1 Tax=Polypterus senegalus TaxID=55291 RepID=UPI001963BE99|nr:chromogranin-A isoform X1 [Polypterus senegalus]
MLSSGVLLFTVVIQNAFSSPLPSEDNGAGKEKVLKCFMEVLADALSNPEPKPVSHECLDTLRGDERVASALRHQNLLKELQELAAQGANDRAQLRKRSDELANHVAEVLEEHREKEADLKDSLSIEEDDEKVEDENVPQAHLSDERLNGSGKVVAREAASGEQRKESEEDGASQELGVDPNTKDNSEQRVQDNSSTEKSIPETPTASQNQQTSSSEDKFGTPVNDTAISEGEHKMESQSNLAGATALAEQLTGEEASAPSLVQRGNEMTRPDTAEERSQVVADLSALQKRGRPLEDEDGKDDEGSGNQKREEQELESLAAIESELEKVAEKLHQMRS